MMTSASVERNAMGRLNDPDGSAFVTGLCGDTMEMYVVIAGDAVRTVRYFTDGCEASNVCGATAARLARGKTIAGVLRLSPGDVIDACGETIEGNVHCAILAVTTLHKALTDYLLRFQAT